MADIDIGAPAINRDTGWAFVNFTVITEYNPANDNGTITTIEIFPYTELANCKVATFIDEGSNVFSTRDSETIGSVTGGSKQTFSGLDMDVQTGDYLGWRYTAGALERDTSGGIGNWYKSGDYIPCSSETFSYASANDILSLYGEGEAAGGVTEKFSSDVGSGVDAVAAGYPQAVLTSSDAGSGVDDKASDNPKATVVSEDSGSGADVVASQEAALVASDTGTGLDETISLEEFYEKISADTGLGVDAVVALVAGLTSEDSGVGVDAVVSIEKPGGFVPRKTAYDGYRCFIQQYVQNKILGATPWKLPDGTKW